MKDNKWILRFPIPYWFVFLLVNNECHSSYIEDTQLYNHINKNFRYKFSYKTTSLYTTIYKIYMYKFCK